MLKTIFNWFTGKPLPGTTAPAVAESAAPYKIEAPSAVAPTTAPAPVVSDGGTWPFPTAVPPEPAKKPRARKAPAAAIKAAEKPAAKKPARPRAKKAPAA